MLKSALACLLALTFSASAQSLSHTAPGNITLTVTAEGLSSIRAGDRELAKGSWTAFNAETWFKDSGSKKVQFGKPAEKSIEVLNDRRARVRHAAGDVVCTYDYTFDGEDLLISTRVENNHANDPVNVLGFTGLTFTFDRIPTGILRNQHISYFQAHGLSLCHPGHWSPVGGSYASDDTVGVGISPWSTGLMRTLILWDYDSAPDQREKSLQRRPIYFVNQPVPPRGSATVDLRLRFSANRDWKHLLDPYRQHFQRTFGPVRYKADHRWIATDYLNHSQKAVSPANPYGFHGQHRRIDTPDGAKLFCDTLIPKIKDANGQGVIVWGQGGDDPRGGMYRPDFDILPPEVEAQWPTILQRFKEAGLKFGVTTRPRHLAVRGDWKQDAIIDINPLDPGHQQMIWKRFENMTKTGVNMFYLDSFGSSFEDVVLMQFLREKLGPDVLTFAEHQCDAMMVYSGGYSETTFTADANDGKGAYRVWSGLDNWEIYQYLAPGSQLSARLYEVKGKLTPGHDQPAEFFYRNRITPLLPVSDWSRLGQ